MLTADQQQHLLRVARAALEAKVRGTREDEYEAAAVSLRSGAFVTILSQGELRGCLGRVTSSLPLTGLVRQLGRAVADGDPRFDAVRQEELSHITFEISVLTREREIASIDEIELGRHGLIVQEGSSRGLLLPQVPAEQGWDREAFLTYTCIKAGLTGDAWRRGVRLFVFEAHVFREEGD